MAKTQATGSPKMKPQNGMDLTAGEYQTFAVESAEDKRIMQISTAVAVILHLVLLAIKFPDIMQGRTLVPEKPKVYVVQQVRFKPPPPRQEQEIPQPKAKKVPIPDPTPDEPEPIREIDEDEEMEIDVPDTDLIFDIPSGPPAAAPEGPIMVTSEVNKPVKTAGPDPVYTEIARKARIQGVVIVQAIINEQGNVTNVKVLKSLPMGLDQAAVDAVKKWRFQPATLKSNGKPVAVFYNLTVNFRIQ